MQHSHQLCRAALTAGLLVLLVAVSGCTPAQRLVYPRVESKPVPSAQKDAVFIADVQDSRPGREQKLTEKYWKTDIPTFAYASLVSEVSASKLFRTTATAPAPEQWRIETEISHFTIKSTHKSVLIPWGVMVGSGAAAIATKKPVIAVGTAVGFLAVLVWPITETSHVECHFVVKDDQGHEVLNEMISRKEKVRYNMLQLMSKSKQAGAAEEITAEEAETASRLLSEIHAEFLDKLKAKVAQR